MTDETTRPTLRQLAIFQATIVQGSVGAAARRLGLSQPAVSHALARLESVIGTALLTRGQGGSVGTVAGDILHRRVVRMHQQIYEGIAAAGGTLDADRIAHNAAALTSTQVRTHVAIADHGAFQRAAQALGISPPALHRTAHELERLIGAPLYRRLQTSLGVTEAGAALARRFQIALREIEQAIDEIALELGAADGRIALGCLPLMPKPLLAQAIGQLLARFPTVAVALVEDSYDALMLGLRSGRFDAVLGALRDPQAPSDVVEAPLFADPYVVIAHRHHPLAARTMLTPAMMARQSWVAPTNGTPRRAALDQLFERLPARPRIVLETNSVAMLLAALTESDCLALSSRAQALASFGGNDLTRYRER
jgi:LysR family transcriptional regulator of gallate degradation